MREVILMFALFAAGTAAAQSVDDLEETYYRTVFTNPALLKKDFMTLLETDKTLVGYALSVQAGEKCKEVGPSIPLRDAVADDGIFRTPYGARVYLVTQKMMMPPDNIPNRTLNGLCTKLAEFIRAVENSR
ncbi:hypothetical protein [Shinella sp.]|uniref:hypothetical protein n=1 Tax=Shinella sp. TaxID=1870904 RepID=UPI0029B58E4C|nr:hypothetical protein [Shinella sp.]MDX3973302.1 hypothetical protein [Shinella sp.]